MRYDIKRLYPRSDKKKDIATELKDCGSLEIMRQLIYAIDSSQNFEAVVCGPEREE